MKSTDFFPKPFRDLSETFRKFRKTHLKIGGGFRKFRKTPLKFSISFRNFRKFSEKGGALGSIL